MSKPGIEVQVEKWLEGRGRWLRSGGDNLVRYLSVMLGNGDQANELLDLLTASELPGWLYTECDGRRVTLIGLTQWRTDQAVEYDEVSNDSWEIVALQYAEIGRLQRQLADARGQLGEYEQLCSQMTDPQVVVLPVTAPEPVRLAVCDHTVLNQELTDARRKGAAFESANANKQEVIAGLQTDLRVAQKAEKSARRAARKVTDESSKVIFGYLELIRMAASSRRDPELAHQGRVHLATFTRMFSRIGGPMPSEMRQRLKQLEQQIGA